MSNLYLAHHGILGQKWGIRRYQNKDGSLTAQGREHYRSKATHDQPNEETTLHAGTRINSVSTTKNSERYRTDGRWKYGYNPHDDWDSKIYRGPFSRYLFSKAYDKVYEHSFEVTKDLKMPTSKERIDGFIEVYSKNAAKVANDLASIQAWAQRYDIGSDASRKVDLSNLKTNSDYKAAYELFNHAMENWTRFESTREYANLMSKKFDAMVDDNNQGVYNRAHDPVIVFRADEALRTIGKARVVTVKEISQAYNDVQKELSKHGERIKL